MLSDFCQAEFRMLVKLTCNISVKRVSGDISAFSEVFPPEGHFEEYQG